MTQARPMGVAVGHQSRTQLLQASRVQNSFPRVWHLWRWILMNVYLCALDFARCLEYKHEQVTNLPASFKTQSDRGERGA